MDPSEFVGRFIQYTGKEKVKIDNIKIASGYPEHFSTYYEIYYIENGVEKWYVNLPERDFNEKNEIFSVES